MEIGKKTSYCIIVPVYCEAESLNELTDRIEVVFSKMGAANNFYLLFIDDGSRDETPIVIKELVKNRPFVRSITLRGNMGKSLALMTGFKASDADIVITMDGDLQDNPEDIPKLVAKLGDEHHIVNGWRQGRKDTTVRKLGSQVYNFVVGRVTKLFLHDHNCGMKAFRRETVKALCIYGQFHRYIPLISHLMGFSVVEEKITNSERKYGVSKFNTFRYEGLFDLFSIMFLYRYGYRPLHFFGMLSALFVIPSVSLIGVWSVQHLMWLTGILGSEFILLPRPLLFLSLTALMIGVIIFVTGLMCDFILHHTIRGNIDRAVKLVIKRTNSGND